MEYITNKRGEQVTFDEFITWPLHQQHSWSTRGVTKGKWTPEQREAHSKRMSKIRGKWTPEQREAHKQKVSVHSKINSKALWQDPAYREKVSLGSEKARAKKRLTQTPEQREAHKQKRSETSKALWQDPAYRQKQLEIRKKMVDQKIN